MFWFSKYLLPVLSVGCRFKEEKEGRVFCFVFLDVQLILHFNHLKRLAFCAMCQERDIIKVYLEWRSIKMIAGNLAASRCCGQSNWPEIIEVWYSKSLTACWKKKRSPTETDSRPVSVYCVHLKKKKSLSSRSIGHKATQATRCVRVCVCMCVGGMTVQRERVKTTERRRVVYSNTVPSSMNVWLWEEGADKETVRERRRGAYM